MNECMKMILAVQVHVRKGRPLERLLFQTAEVALTAAAVCLITLASNHVRQKGNKSQATVTHADEQDSNKADRAVHAVVERSI